MTISLIAALSKNDVIGINNTLPWKLSGDLKHFKELTLGKPIVMGRKTFSSLGKPLPGRENIVISRDVELVLPDVKIFHQLDTLLEYCNTYSETMIIGGSEIYQLFLPYAHTLYLTRVHAIISGDAFFPKIDYSQWNLIEKLYCVADEKNQYNYDFETWKKKT